jgi:hypothetical protein
MNKTLILLFIINLITPELTFSQKNDSVYTKVDLLPDFNYETDTILTYADLEKKLIEFYRENTKLKVLNSRFETAAYTGLLISEFVVEKDGKLSQIDVTLRGINADEKEIEKLLVKTEKWKPAIINGKAVRMRLSIRIYVNVEE